MPRQITKQRLDQLVQGRQYSIVTQHLGKGTEDFPFNTTDIQLLKLLKTYQDEGKVLVARTAQSESGLWCEFGSLGVNCRTI